MKIKLLDLLNGGAAAAFFLLVAFYLILAQRECECERDNSHNKLHKL